MRVRRRVLGLLLFGLASCASDDVPPPGRVGKDTPTTTSVSIDAPAAVVRAYRPEGNAFVARLGTYTSRIDHRGALLFLPRPQRRAARITESSAIGIEVQSIERGGIVLAATSSLPMNDVDGGVIIRRGPVVEHLRSEEIGVEQSWSFETPLGGHGDVVLRLRTDGARYDHEIDGGLQFVDSSSGVGLRYGIGTWIDAKGARTEIPARWIDEAIELRVPEQVVDTSTYPAVLDPTIGLEFNPGEMPVPVAPNDEDPIAIASDGSDYLLVWTNARAGASDIYGVRVTSTGKVLDPAGFAVSAADNWQRSPSVGFDGKNYVVAWLDGRDARDFHQVVYAARVGTDGTVLDPAGIAVMNVAGVTDFEHSTPVIACRVAECLVVWSDVRNYRSTGWDVFGARIDASGMVLDPSSLVLGITNGMDLAQGVAWDGTSYLVVWQGDGAHGKDIFGSRVSTAGKPLDVPPMLVSTDDISGDKRSPGLAFDGTRYLVVWDQLGDIHGVRVGTDGAILDAPSLVISNAGHAQSRPGVAATGDRHNFLVAWQDLRGGKNDDVFATWLAGDHGALLHPGGLLVAGTASDERAPVLVGRGAGHTLVAYVEQDATTATMHAAARLLDSDKLDGSTCTGPGDCTSRLCIDGFCCEKACDPACETCGSSASPGKCVCNGLSTCASNPTCKKMPGVRCASESECSSGHCTDGFCCGSACNGGCDVCSATPGTCTLRSKGTLGADPSCAPGYLCDGVSAKCPIRCEADSSCAPGHYCSAGQGCTPFCAGDVDCPTGSRCDTTSGKCVSGATCDKDHTLTLANGQKKDCAPYVCTSAGACLQKCMTSVDCAAGYQCDENGACAVPTGATGAGAGRGCGCRLDGVSAFGAWRLAGYIGFGVMVMARARASGRRRRSR